MKNIAMKIILIFSLIFLISLSITSISAEGLNDTSSNIFSSSDLSYLETSDNSNEDIFIEQNSSIELNELADGENINEENLRKEDILKSDNRINSNKLSSESGNVHIDSISAKEGDVIELITEVDMPTNWSVGTVTYQISGSDYFNEFEVPVQYGEAKLILNNSLKPGYYECVANFSGGYHISSYVRSGYKDFYINITGNAKILTNNYTAYYNSGKKVTFKVLNSYTGKPFSNAWIKISIYNSSNNKKISTDYGITNSNGEYKRLIDFDIGKYKIVVELDEKDYKCKSVTTYVKVTKAKTKMRAYKDTWWYGDYSTLYVELKDSKGNPITEGKVKFRINGKSYTVKVGKYYGEAFKNLKLPKAKTYKYTATFTSKHYQTKKVNSTVKVKPTYKTKVIVSSVTGYSNKKKTITVKIRRSNGKKLSSYGTIAVRFNGTTKYYDVNKKGIAKFTIKLGNNLRGYTAFGLNQYYYKKVVKKCKITYYSITPKYRDSSKTIKVRIKYKCPACGKTKTHKHGIFTDIYVY